MPSLEYERFIESMSKKRSSAGGEESLDTTRKRMRRLSAARPAPSFAHYSPLVLNGVYTEVTSLGTGRSGKAVMYLHGGGFKLGFVEDDRNITAELARRTGASVVAVEYALAPENRFPAAFDDCLSVYNGLLGAGYQASDIVLVGVSAGGNLALAAVLALKDMELPLPRTVVAVSPASFLDGTSGDHTKDATRDAVFGNSGTPEDTLAIYAPDEDPRDAYVSPLYGDYTGFPPLLVIVGEHDIRYEDAMLLADKARAAGVEVELTVGEGMFHVYPMFLDAFPEADAAFGDMCAHISRYLAE